MQNAQCAAEIATRAQAELLVFPELYLSGYDLASASDHSVSPDGPEIARVREAAAQCGTAVALGFAERRGSAVANAVALIDERGELNAVYRKVQLFGAEQSVFEPGEELVVWDLGQCRAGVLICFDMEFPELARRLAQAGADLLITVSANMEPFYSDHRIAAQARALDNRLPHLYCNRCGSEAGLRFVGGSRCVAEDGLIVAEAGDGEHLLRVEPPYRPHDDRVDYLAQLPDQIPVGSSTTVTGDPR